MTAAFFVGFQISIDIPRRLKISNRIMWDMVPPATSHRLPGRRNIFLLTVPMYWAQRAVQEFLPMTQENLSSKQCWRHFLTMVVSSWLVYLLTGLEANLEAFHTNNPGNKYYA